MPRYFFDFLNGTELTRDELGVELESDESASFAAAGVFADLASEAAVAGTQRVVRVTVRSDAGKTLLETTIPLPAFEHSLAN